MPVILLAASTEAKKIRPEAAAVAVDGMDDQAP